VVQVINVYPGLFARDGLRMGDLIAACNFLEYARQYSGSHYLKMYIPSTAINGKPHCFKMAEWLFKNTDYLSDKLENPVDIQVPQWTDATYPDLINLWNIRKDVLTRKQFVLDIPDLVRLPGPHRKKRKIVLAPLIDADYNQDRNWTVEYTQKIVNRFNYYAESIFPTEMIIASKDVIQGLDVKAFTYSHDFEQNLEHVLECECYIGGDTGMSHFAGALMPGPVNCFYHYPKSTYGTTNPFHWKIQGNMTYY
jgi:hypothetical protein